MSVESISPIGLSGANAASLEAFAAAGNIANSLTDSSKRLEIAQSTLPEGGTNAELVLSNASNDKLEQDIVSQISAIYSFKANLISIRTADELTGTLLNLKG